MRLPNPKEINAYANLVRAIAALLTALVILAVALLKLLGHY